MDKYHLDCVLGEGTFGKVWLARLKTNNQKVAIKMFKKKPEGDQKKKGGSSDNSDHQTKPEEEAMIMESLDHPNIVKMLEFISTNDTMAMVMDYAPRGDMLAYMNRRPKLCFVEETSKVYFKQLISAIKYLHDLGYIHCDIKLENILLFDDDLIKLTDFGFAIKYSMTKKMKYGNGSLSYASPEVIFKREFHGPEADIWSLGVVLFSMVCGKFPLNFSNQTVGQAYKKLESEGLSIPDGVSLECQDLLAQMLEIYADKRITMAKILASDWITGNKSYLQPDVVKLNLDKLQAMAPGLLSPNTPTSPMSGRQSPIVSSRCSPKNSPGRLSPKISPKVSPKASAQTSVQSSPKLNIVKSRSLDEYALEKNKPSKTVDTETTMGSVTKVSNPVYSPRHSPQHSPKRLSQDSPGRIDNSPTNSRHSSPNNAHGRVEKEHIFKSAFRFLSPGHRRHGSLSDVRQSETKPPDVVLKSRLVTILEEEVA